MYSAQINITITQFTPTDGIIGSGNSVAATLSEPVNTSPNPVPGTFTGSGQNLTVNVSPQYDGQVQLNLNLSSPHYILIGVAFTPSSGRLGRTEFPVIANNRSSHQSLLTITDICDPAESNILFNYGIVVQQVSTGQIGIIDPRVETDN
jgi:hypothetical protein